ncbi:MAG: SUF system NifU family Fe-S cluster assembly protein [Chloroflexi bacterium]|nr:SUF system NifU family Fe-S cluster assembly protein [Chloroflexota bacterium]
MPNVPDVPLDGLYGDLILDHYRKPRNRTPVDDADLEAEEFNPFCGDRVKLQIKLDETGKITEASAQAEGCSIIQASTSMMAQMAVGRTLRELEQLSGRFRDIMRGLTTSDEMTVDLGDLNALKVVRQFPVRIKCALLPWTALEEGIEEFRARAG